MKIDHSLIDREDPRCLYCHGKCEVKHSGEWTQKASTIERDILTCSFCHEAFEIYEMQDADGHTSQTGFSFTCQGCRVFFSYADDSFYISKHQGTKEVITPPFEVDFSDKQKLSEKLKTYLVFS